MPESVVGDGRNRWIQNGSENIKGQLGTASFSLTPCFSGVCGAAWGSVTVSTVCRTVETVETVARFVQTQDTQLKQGVNEIQHGTARSL